MTSPAAHGHEVAGLPAGAGADGAAVFQRLEEAVGGEGVVRAAAVRGFRAGAGVPRGGVHLGQGAEDGDLDGLIVHGSSVAGGFAPDYLASDTRASSVGRGAA